MEKLELKHLAAYLPYGLKCYAMGHTDELNNPIVEELLGIYDGWDIYISNGEKENQTCFILDVFPILRPLSDLNKATVKEMKLNFISDKFLTLQGEIEGFYGLEVYEDFEILFKNHFDVFGLIEKGLAIDINTLK